MWYYANTNFQVEFFVMCAYTNEFAWNYQNMHSSNAFFKSVVIYWAKNVVSSVDMKRNDKTIPLVNLISFRLNYRNNDHFNDTNHTWQCKDELNTNSITLLIREKCIPTSNIQTELTIPFVFDLRVFLIHMRNLLFQINFNLAIFGRLKSLFDI